MLAFPHMLVPAATDAGLAVPEDVESYDPNSFPHWFVFSKMQLGAAMPWPGCHFENAKVIASVPETDIRNITPAQLGTLGFALGYPMQ